MSAELSGCDAEEIVVDENETVGVLKKMLLNRHPKLSGTQFQLAIDMSIANGNEKLLENSEIAVLPPFAGG